MILSEFVTVVCHSHMQWSGRGTSLGGESVKYSLVCPPVERKIWELNQKILKLGQEIEQCNQENAAYVHLAFEKR